VHPDILRIDHVFYPSVYVMVMEPYPYGDDSCENPSLVCSQDGFTWTEPEGLSNPVVSPPATSGAWHSDADLLNDGGERLILYYRYNSGAGETTLFFRQHDAGVTWSAPKELFSFATSGRFASPAVVPYQHTLRMFYVDTIACSVNCLSGENPWQWRDDRVLLRFPRAWHLDAICHDDTTYILLNDRQALFLLRSRDLAAWTLLDSAEGKWVPFNEAAQNHTRCSPLLVPSEQGWDNQRIYRGTLLIEHGRCRVWYSAQSQGNAWRVGYTDGCLPE
jgi:hypothetical protein